MPERDRHEPLDHLIGELLEGRLTAEETEALGRLLHDDPQARRVYLRQVTTHAMLQWELASPLQPHDGQAAGQEHFAPQSLDRLPAPAAEAISRVEDPQVAAQPMPADRGILRRATPRASWLLTAAVAASLLIAMVLVLSNRGLRHGDQGDGGNQQTANPPAPSAQFPAPRPLLPAPVAQLVRTAGCRWADQESEHADRLSVGQSLHLASGVAEIQFDIGVKVVLQAPASFLIQSAKSARLDRGKLTASVTTEAAHGFRIDTPEAVYVDQGTEFGVEVSPGGSSRACVFKGRVDVAAKGEESAKKQLTAEQGVRVEDDGQDMTFIEDRGESFIQSVDEADRDRHVIAYWRFEDRPVGTVLPHTAGNKNPVRATSDSSFSGNDLFVWSPNSRPVFSGSVSSGTVPQSGAANKSCLDLTDPLHSNKTRPEVYTNSHFSHAAPHDLQQITPESWTVEASVKIKKLEHARQTIVCRDGVTGKPARFGLLVNPDGGFSVNFRDVKDRYFSAVSAASLVKEGQWYHLAATSDGRVLRLYVDSGDGKGYQLSATTPLRSSGTALGSCGDDCSWAVGRCRLTKGTVGDALLGWIDEVRICDEALDPSEFLFAPKKAGEKERAEVE